jgi:hypothetical protein
MDNNHLPVAQLPAGTPRNDANSPNSGGGDVAVAANYFDPEWLEDVVWVAQRVNKHSLTNKWLLVDESRCFELLMKEHKAVTTQQCRILVKGAAHLPLQLSCGTSVQFLYPTWQYLKLIEASGAVPNVPAARYREVEDWMVQHMREFQDQRLIDASALPHGLTSSATCNSFLATSASSNFALPPASVVESPQLQSVASMSSATAQAAGTAASPDAAPGNTVGPQPRSATPSGALRSRLKGFFDKKTHRSSTPAPGASASATNLDGGRAPTPTGQPPASESPRSTPAAHAPMSAATSTTPGAGDSKTSPSKQLTAAAAVTKRQAVADFLRRKLRSKEAVEAAMEHSGDDDDDDFAPHGSDGAFGSSNSSSMAPPTATAATDNMASFRLSAANIERIVAEFRKEERVHATFDRLFRRRRAVTKWEYEQREAIMEQIKANRTVTAMVLVGFYTMLMHIVPFDLFLLLLMLLQLLVYYVCTNYRSMAMDFGRRAARTRVDRIKDWFFFGVTRRKQRTLSQETHLHVTTSPNHAPAAAGAHPPPAGATHASAGPSSVVVNTNITTVTTASTTVSVAVVTTASSTSALPAGSPVRSAALQQASRPPQ